MAAALRRVVVSIGYSGRRAAIASAVVALVLFGLAAWSSFEPARRTSLPMVAPAAAVADFGGEAPRADARFMANWVVRNNDAAGAPFVIIDKIAATIYVFDGNGRLHGSAPVLLGAAIGDDTVTGIGDRAIADVLPHERTTPAGRFVGEPGHNARGEDVVWVDYDAGVSMHRVLTSNPAERRLERLQTPTVEDNRISYGCINIPRDFYEAHVRPAFSERRAVVYILPDVRPLREVFALDRDSH
jgi:hypothetical protein